MWPLLLTFGGDEWDRVEYHANTYFSKLMIIKIDKWAVDQWMLLIKII